jgi:hypothetical protein
MQKFIKDFYQNWLGGEINNLIIIGVGLWVRYLRVARELVWGEETIYLGIAKAHSIQDLLLVKHWLIDHPQLYLVWSKVWTMLGTNPFWLRLPNLIVYVLSAVMVVKIGKEIFDSRVMRIVLLGFYGLFPYFVGIEWQAVPYFLAIYFSLLSLYYAVVIIKTTTYANVVGKLGISLALFLYTSFEGLYFAGAIAIFATLAYLFKQLSKVKVWQLGKSLMLAGAIFVPEVIIVFIRMQEFLTLADKFETRGYHTGEFLARLFFLPPFNWALYGVAGIAIIYGYFRFTKNKNERVILMFLTTMLIGSAAIIYVMSVYLQEVRHPRAFYYLVFIAGAIALKLIEGYGKLSRYVKEGLLIGLLLLTLRYAIVINDNWKEARYAYARPYVETLKMRSELINFLQTQNDKGEPYKLVMGDNLMMGRWYEGVYLYDYYFNCLDLKDRGQCRVIQEASVVVDNNEAIKQEKGQRLVGVFVTLAGIEYFKTEVCPGQQACYIWDYQQVKFSELKQN